MGVQERPGFIQMTESSGCNAEKYILSWTIDIILFVEMI